MIDELTTAKQESIGALPDTFKPMIEEITTQQQQSVGSLPNTFKETPSSKCEKSLPHLELSQMPPAAANIEKSAAEALEGDTGAELKALPELSNTLAHDIFQKASFNHAGDAYFATAGKSIDANNEMLQAFAMVDVKSRGPSGAVADGLSALDEAALRDSKIMPILKDALNGINMKDTIPIKLALGKEELTAGLGISLIRDELPKTVRSSLAGTIAKVGKALIRSAF